MPRPRTTDRHRRRPLRVLQGLVVEDVIHDGAVVTVEVTAPRYGRQRITFAFDDGWEAAGQAEHARQWMARRRELTYVTGRGHAALIDDAEAFRRAFGDELPDVV